MQVPPYCKQQNYLLLLVILALVHSASARNLNRVNVTPSGLHADSRIGFSQSEVSYSAPFAVGLDPLCILAGLAFLAFLVQTLYLALHKPIGMGALLGAGPLAERRNRVSVGSEAETRVRAALSRYEDLQNDSSELEERTIPMDSSGWQKSPLAALMSLTRAAWQNPECGGGLMCRLWFLARLLVGPAFWPRNVQPVKLRSITGNVVNTDQVKKKI